MPVNVIFMLTLSFDILRLLKSVFCYVLVYAANAFAEFLHKFIFNQQFDHLRIIGEMKFPDVID